jgi:hypothetical protein
MDELETNYQGKRLRYYDPGGNDLLLNTEDVCAILESKPEFLNNKYVDLADAVSAALQINETFSEWLLAKFSGYNPTTGFRTQE